VLTDYSNNNRQYFFDDELIGATSAPLSGGSTPCAGDSTEICGNVNRIDVYQDVLWFIPSIQDRINAIIQLNTIIIELQQEITEYQTDVTEAKAQGTTQSSGKRDGGVLYLSQFS
jgi:hypothetical protein